jgi:hypothetical protein
MAVANKTNIDWDSLDTGDILLFHGKNYWFSYIVEWFSWSDFSHIGMILRDPVYLDPRLKGLYMLESGAENFPDAIEHRIMWGVQIVNLDKVIQTYVGDVYIRKLRVVAPMREKMMNELPAIWQLISNRPYDDQPWDLIRTIFDLNWGDNDRYNSYVCSALITFLYEKFGFFSKDIPWDLVLPKDYDDTGKMNEIFIEGIGMTNKFLVKTWP